MQKFTRTVGESVVIGGDIQLTILDIKGSQAWIGVSGPNNELAEGKGVTKPRSSSPPLISGYLMTEKS